jgi:hypothetical protein
VAVKRTRTIFLLAILSLLVSCERPRFVTGESCEINTDCAEPLVCAIDACRRACVTSRDCGAGLICLISVGSTFGGACQLDTERSCLYSSDCTMGLLCQNGTCTTECLTERDCLDHATCDEDDAGVRACHDENREACVYNTDCPAPLICDHDQICRLECLTDRDCTTPRHCVASLCELVDGGL